MPPNLCTELLAQLGEPFTGEILFDHLTYLVFFIKNKAGAYVAVNRSLAERCGYRHKSDLIGRTADQVYPSPLGERYREQDETLLQTGKPILNQLELQIYPSRGTGWCLTHKVPLRGKKQDVIGLVGISNDLNAPSEKSEDYSPMAETIEHIQTHFDQPLRLSDLAQRTGLSVYQFEQRIYRIFELTVGQFIQKVRMDAAIRRLEEANDAITDIALDCGYSDQSTFSRQFKQVVGLSPGQYRRLKQRS